MVFWFQQFQCQLSFFGVNNSGVWIFLGKNEFYVVKGSFIGIYWNYVVFCGIVFVIKWVFVLVFVVFMKEGSFLWLCQSSKDLCSVSVQSVQLWFFIVQLFFDVEMCVYVVCQDVLWVLDGFGQVFIRMFFKSCFMGMYWIRLDFFQLGVVKLISLVCGNQYIWVCDFRGGVYFCVGIQFLNFSFMFLVWIMIELFVQFVGVNLVSVYFSFNDQMLWVFDSRWNVYVWIGIIEEMFVGIVWEYVLGLQVCQLVLSIRIVWVCCLNGDFVWWYGIIDKNFVGDYWKKIFGSVVCFIVIVLDELWVVGFFGYFF